MPDFDSTHAIVATVTGTGGAGIMGGLMAWLRGKEAREMRDAFIALQGDVKRLLADVEKLGDVRSDVTRTTDKVNALHIRVDDLEDRIVALEGRRQRARPRTEKSTRRP